MKSCLWVQLAVAGILSVSTSLPARAQNTPKQPNSAQTSKSMTPPGGTSGPFFSEIKGNPPPRKPLQSPSPTTFDRLPVPVQRNLLLFAQGSGIDAVEQGTLQGHPVYQARFNHNGRKIELRLRPDGALVWDDVDSVDLGFLGVPWGAESRSALGKAPAFEKHSGTESSASAALNGARQITFDQLPLPVLSALQAQAGAETLTRLEKGTWHGIPAYEAVVGQGGKQGVILFGADGKVLSRK